MEHYYKLFIIGNSAVGKTSLIQRFFKDSFSFAVLSTIGIEILKKQIDLDGEKVNLQIQDTCGQERFRSICSQYYSKVDGIIIAFGLNDKKSFTEIDKWVVEVKKNASPDACLLLTGCKEDLVNEREVSFEEAQKYAENNNMIYVETSSKTGHNIKELFEMISWAIKDKGTADQEPKTKSSTFVISKNNDDDKKSSCSC